MTFIEDDSPPRPAESEEVARAVLAGLLHNGRWADAARYCARIDWPDTLLQAQLLLASGTSSHAVSSLIPPASEESAEALTTFLRTAAEVIGGDAHKLSPLIQQIAGKQLNPLLAMVMLRAAQAGGQEDLAAYYGQQVLATIPGEVDAAQTVAVDRIAAGEYIDAVTVLDRARTFKADDTLTPLQLAANTLVLRDRRAQLRALSAIGYYSHRETDPTLPVSDTWKTICREWRDEFKRRVPNDRWIKAVRLLILAGALTLSIVVRNALPAFVVGAATVLWSRYVPVPGLDQKTSRILRALYDPLLILQNRRYKTFDVFVSLMASVIVGGVLARLPHGPGWLTPIEIAVAVAAGAAATRARRRWVRRDNQALDKSRIDPARCSCQEFTQYRGTTGRRYITEHLFNAGPAPAASEWNLLQCLQTYAMFLDMPTAGLALRLPQPS